MELFPSIHPSSLETLQQNGQQTNCSSDGRSWWYWFEITRILVQELGAHVAAMDIVEGKLKSLASKHEGKLEVVVGDIVDMKTFWSQLESTKLISLSLKRQIQ